MRTTVTIDDDLAARIEALRRREGLSLREALDRLLRRALQADATPPRARRYRTRPRKLGLRAGLDAAKLNPLVDELEVEDFEASVRR
jgi:Arc/MetJ family transcription regulator